MASNRMRTRVRIACEHLVNHCGGCKGNPRHEAILIAAITSAPVCEALEDAIDYYSKHYEEAREAARNRLQAKPASNAVKLVPLKGLKDMV